jgi:hypothetical protein
VNIRFACTNSRRCPYRRGVAAVGQFLARRGEIAIGEATLRMHDALNGSLALNGVTWPLSGDPSARGLRGDAQGSAVDLRIVTRSFLKGTVDAGSVDLTRIVLPPIPAAEMAQADAGPTGSMQAVMTLTPDYRAGPSHTGPLTGSSVAGRCPRVSRRSDS